MAIEAVRKYFEEIGLRGKVLEFDSSSATVELAAQVLGVIPARIAKTLAFQNGESCILVVAAGDAKVDNAKFKKHFSLKARMLSAENTLSLVGHPVGGVCPFVVNDSAEVYLDESLKRFGTVFPACGSANSAIELNCDQLYQYANTKSWVDVCKDWF